MIKISDREFELMKSLIYEHFGIHLNKKKRPLLIGRLQALLIDKGFSSFTLYYDYILKDKSGYALVTLVNHITTNYTYFNREKSHFEFLERISLPEITTALKKQKDNDIRIWCAGCASGEEAYMITMTLLEYFGFDYSKWKAGILATDISSKVLNIAKAGNYTDDNIKRLPEPLIKKYFTKNNGKKWTAADKLKNEITFRRFNLIEEYYPFKKPFHIIFCRNVMIYFDEPTKNSLIKKFFKFSVKGAYLFIGHSETIGRENCPFKYVKPSIYKKVTR